MCVRLLCFKDQKIRILRYLKRVYKNQKEAMALQTIPKYVLMKASHNILVMLDR